MKKTHHPDRTSPEMRDEYDFRGGERGKHATAYEREHAVRIRQRDGKVVEQHFTLEEGAVLLAPDVRPYFPDSDSVNSALRSLIALIPEKRSRRKPAVNEE